MSAILRWFHDGDVRYRAYFRASPAAPTVRELIIASRDGEAVDVVADDRRLEDFSYAELLTYARRLREQLNGAGPRTTDAAAD
ncbi:MAG TPA: hypothetical protein VFZ69_16075 [Longimicrobiales bacterium]